MWRKWRRTVAAMCHTVSCTGLIKISRPLVAFAKNHMEQKSFQPLDYRDYTDYPSTPKAFLDPKSHNHSNHGAKFCQPLDCFYFGNGGGVAPKRSASSEKFPAASHPSIPAFHIRVSSVIAPFPM